MRPFTIYKGRTDLSVAERAFRTAKHGRRLLARVCEHLKDRAECPEWMPELFMQIDQEISRWGARLEGKNIDRF